MKGAVISGGGSWGVATAANLYVNRPEYDFAVGCSTGSLIAPFVLLEDYEKLKEAYTTVSQSDIFNVNPFNNNGNINIPQAIWRVVRGKQTLGENENLLKTIRKFFTPEDFQIIRKSGKQLWIAVCNYSFKQRRKEFVSIHSCDYDTFTRFMWASCSVPLACSIVDINENQYVDAGVTEGVPLQFAVQKGCQEIDVYLHDVKTEIDEKKKPIENIFHNFMRTFSWMHAEIRGDDMALINLANVRAHYLPFKPDYDLLIFDAGKMGRYFRSCKEHFEYYRK